MANFDWSCIPRSYEISKNYLQSYETLEHPLKISTVTVIESKGTRGGGNSSSISSRSSSVASMLVEPLGSALDGSDPLSQFARQEEEFKDPLNEPLTQFSKKQRDNIQKPIDEEDTPSVSWSSKRLSILNRFTTTEKLSISTSFLRTGSTEGGTETIKAQTVVADKVKFRLEQLDHFEDSSLQHMMNLTQQEYFQRFEQLKHELVQSWNSDQRVKALKIAIQCSKMLTDTGVLQFYPSQYVLITDILDTFGKLVYERLKAKDAQSNSKESSRETCQNWFYKIASIRDLVPRLYVEMAIFKCYQFLPPNDYEENLIRLTRMLRGIGDPLINAYARCYLVRVGLTLPNTRDYLKENFNDFIAIYSVIFSGSTRSEILRQRIDMTMYLSLYGPALDFMLQALLQKIKVFVTEIMQQVQQLKHNGLLLNSILNSFTPDFVSANALEFIQLIANSNTEGIAKSQLFRLLGFNLSQCAPLQELRLQCLQEAFRTINSFTDPTEYVSCVETWIQFIAENFQVSEINSLLLELNKRMCIGKAYEKHYQPLQSILDKLMLYFKNIEQLLVQEHFLPYLDLFHKESIKVEVCKNILTVYKQNCQEFTNDPIIINSLMYIGKLLNDSVTAMTVEDERRQISQLICFFIRKVNFERDVEKQLSFYVEARGTFANLEAVFVTLVHAVNKLAMDTKQMASGKALRKAQAFIKACIAYCFITIPSITAVHTQMELYLMTGQVAVVNLCFGQADSCFEEVLQLIEDLPSSIEVDGKPKTIDQYLISFISNFLAVLVVVPDSPDQGVLYFLRLLLDAIAKYDFNGNFSAPVMIYLKALDMLYVQSLETFPYHLPGVVSNDKLYGHDPKFLMEVNNLCGQVVELILEQLNALGLNSQYKQQCTLSLELFNRIIRYADLNRPQTFQLAMHLWLLAIKMEVHVDTKNFVGAVKNVEEIHEKIKETDTERSEVLGKLLKRMTTK